MREIEFRGRALKSKLWVRGYYWTNENGNHFIRQTVDLNGCFRIADIEVDPETVGQYTGLKDKNGVKIYEGDVVKIIDAEYEFIYVANVEFIEGSFVLNMRKGEFMGEILGVDCWEEGEKEVIGNIHDNPELLERKN